MSQYELTCVFLVRPIFFCSCSRPYSSASAVGGHPGTAPGTWTSRHANHECLIMPYASSHINSSKSQIFAGQECHSQRHTHRRCPLARCGHSRARLSMSSGSSLRRWRSCPLRSPIAALQTHKHPVTQLAACNAWRIVCTLGGDALCSTQSTARNESAADLASGHTPFAALVPTHKVYESCRVISDCHGRGASPPASATPQYTVT